VGFDIQRSRGIEEFGRPEEWSEELRRVFEELDVCTAVFGPASDTGNADVLLTLTLERQPARPPQLRSPAGILDLIAWVLPVVSWWAQNVAVDPGFACQVAMKICGPTADQIIKVSSTTGDVDIVYTSFHERQALPSWKHLVAVLIPAFLFRDHDSEHLERTLRDRVRKGLARELALLVKQFRLSNELFKDITLHTEGDSVELRYEPHPDLGKIEYWVESGGRVARGEYFQPVEESVHMSSLRLDIPPTAIQAGQLLHLEAIDRTAKRCLPYTLRVPSADTRPPKAEFTSR
jgi:hypothetical protein